MAAMLPVFAITIASVAPRCYLWGSAPAVLTQLAPVWLQGFAWGHPGFEVRLGRPFGPPQGRLDPNLQRVLDGRGDFAFVSRELSEIDREHYRRTYHAEPALLPVAAGSWSRFGFVDPVVVIVNRSNPLRRIDFSTLDAIFSESHWRSGRAVTEWGRAGAPAWRGRPIHVKGGGGWLSEESARALTIRKRVLSVPGKIGRWRRFADSGNETDAVARVAADPLAIAFTGAGHVRGKVRVLAVSAKPGGAAFLPDRHTVASGHYPLARTVDLLLARRTGGCVAPAAIAFASYLVGPEGQDVVRRSPPFTPLAPGSLREAKDRIAKLVPCPQSSVK